MRQLRDVIDTMDQLYKPAASRGVLYRTAEDEALNGRTVCVDGRDLLYFGSCSYLGLELHPHLKAGAIAAIERYGTQFSSSRAVMSSPPYRELEVLLEQILGVPGLVAPTTTLAHATALPVLIDRDDAVILDQQVHTSVALATNHLVVQGTTVEIVRHNRLDLLEERIKALRQTHRRVWYLADGVYSMFGDFAPMQALQELLGRYACLHLYIDDAHGMTWTGQRGRGHVLEQLPFHERLITVTSLNKAFAAGGAVIAIPDAELRRRLRTVGSSFVFSGPVQPAMLGAAIASAKLHLSGEVEQRQALLQRQIACWNELCRQHGVPLVSKTDSPIRFIACGKPQVAYALAERLMEEGIYATLSVFPAVPMKRGGLRFALNLHQTEADLRHAVQAIAHHLPRELAREGSDLAEVRQAFDLPADEPLAAAPLADETRVVITTSRLTVEHHATAEDLDAAEWDRLLGDRGTYDHAGLRFLEAAFRGNPEPENDWRFHYFLVRDAAGVPVLATFFTETTTKVDMLAPAETSRELERRRLHDPAYMTTRTLTMGSMFSEGNHLYLDRSRDWRTALGLVLQAADALGLPTMVLRDLPAGDVDLDACLVDHGLARVPMPESLELTLDWADEAAYRAGLSKNARKHQAKKVWPFDGTYDVEVLDDAQGLYPLYEAVAARNLEFNTFALPRRIFEVMLRHPRWEILGLRRQGELAAFVACYRGQAGRYVPMVCGLDYRYVETHGAYRQMLRQAIRRAHAEGFKVAGFGFGATHEKTRFGCKARQQVLYMHTRDEYQLEVLAQLMKASGRASG